MKSKKIIAIIMSAFLVTNVATNTIVNATTDIAEERAIRQEGLLIEAENKVITEGEGGDLTNQLNDVISLNEGTAIIRFTENGEGIQSLFSISNGTRGAEHFHVYISSGQVGYELRKASGNVSTGKVSRDLNKGVNTIAFKAVNNVGYSIFLNGEKVLDIEDDDAAFLSSLEGANTFKLGITERSSGNEYGLNGKIDFFEMYSTPLDDQYLLNVTGETVSGEVPAPEGTFKSDPIDIFKPGDLGSPNFRIPALYTTQAGTVLASIDVRNNGGHDAPNNNIDVGIVRSEDNGVTWTDQEIILDYPGRSAAIDTALVQDPESGRIFLMVTHFAEGYGFRNSKTGTGYKEVPQLDEEGNAVVDEDGNPVVNKYLIVNNAANEEYTVREDGVIHDPEGNPTTYTVNEDKELFKDGVRDGHILTGEGDFKMYGTTFITMIHSDDDGRTWSKPVDINKQAKEDWMRFFGTGPGRGHVIKNGEHAGRILFPIYVTNAIGFQSSACLYSDDNGATWHYGESATDGRIKNDGTPASAETMTTSMGLEQLTECQVVEMPDGQIKMFMRNTGPNVMVATSFDGGVTWDDVVEEEEDLVEQYCQLTVLNYSQQVDGKDALIFANPAGDVRRHGGTVRIGLINENGTHENGRTRYEFDWKYSQVIKEGPYAYSCLTELPDGNIGLFYEGTPSMEMSFTAMDTNYIKADLEAAAPSASIVKIENYDKVLSYRPGDTANLKLKFDDSVSLFGDKNLVIDVNGIEIPVTVERLTGSEYKLTGVIPEDMEYGEYSITVKAKEGLEVINSYGKAMDLSNDIVTESKLVVAEESVTNTEIFKYEDLTIVNGTGAYINDEVENVMGLEDGTIFMEFDNKGGNKFQTLLSFSDDTENRERFYVFVTGNNQIGIERQSSTGNVILRTPSLTLNDGMNKIAVKIENGVGYSIFVNGVKAATVENANAKFLDGITGLNSVDIGGSSRAEGYANTFTGEIGVVQLFSDIKSDEELVKLTSEEEVVVVDKSELQTTIDSIDDLVEENYTKVSWAALQAKLEEANAVLADNDATQEVVDEIAISLSTAINNLVTLNVNGIGDIAAPEQVTLLDIAEFNLELGDDVDKVKVTYYWNKNNVEEKYEEYYDVEDDGILTIDRQLRFVRDYRVEFTPIVDKEIQEDQVKSINLNVVMPEESSIIGITGNGDASSTTIENVGDKVTFKVETALYVEDLRFVFETTDSYTEYYSKEAYAEEVDGKLVWTIERAMKTNANLHHVKISTLSEWGLMDTSAFEVNINQ